MARERWSDEDRIKLIRVSEEVSDQYPEMLVEDRHAIVANKIARDGFRPTANAVGSMLSNIQRAKSVVPTNGALPHVDESRALEEIKEEVAGWTDYFDAQFTALLGTLQDQEERQVERHKALLKSLDRTASILDAQSAILSAQLKVLEKLSTSSDVIVDQMDTLVSGLKEAESNG